VSGAPRAVPASAGVNGTLVLVTGQFPEPNETFIVREVGELARRGFDVTVFSLVPPPAVIPDPEARALVPLAVYPPGRGFAARPGRPCGRYGAASPTRSRLSGRRTSHSGS